METIRVAIPEEQTYENGVLDLRVKSNSDGSYSAKVKAGDLIRWAFVDFYDERTGQGYQRNESGREKRGRQIEQYMQRAIQAGTKPALFEMTANIRADRVEGAKFEDLDGEEELGLFKVTPRPGERFLSLIDGGTRFLGIEKALNNGLIEKDFKLDVRIFDRRPFVEEVAYFLLINDTQKKVRTDLSLRVVQQLFDNGEILPGTSEFAFLKTVVPDTENWKYTAVNMVAELNRDPQSRWHQRIQMPGEPSRTIALQAFYSSLKLLLNNSEVIDRLKAKIREGVVFVGERQLSSEDEYPQFLLRILNNFWEAIRQMNQWAYEEIGTTVLWAPIGVSAHHFALSPVLAQMMQAPVWNFSVERFKKMLTGSLTELYSEWWTKAGTKGKDAYPEQQGEATRMTGLANYARLANNLKLKWISNLREDVETGPVTI